MENNCKKDVSNEVVRVVHTSKAPDAKGPYSQALIVGNLVYVSGQLGIDPETGIMPETLEEQCNLVFSNIAVILEAAGSHIGKTVKTTLFLKDVNDFAIVNAIYEQHFSKPYPARSCVAVAAIPKGARLECEAIAMI